MKNHEISSQIFHLTLQKFTRPIEFNGPVVADLTRRKVLSILHKLFQRRKRETYLFKLA